MWVFVTVVGRAIPFRIIRIGVWLCCGGAFSLWPPPCLNLVDDGNTNSCENLTFQGDTVMFVWSSLDFGSSKTHSVSTTKRAGVVVVGSNPWTIEGASTVVGIALIYCGSGCSGQSINTCQSISYSHCKIGSFVVSQYYHECF